MIRFGEDVLDPRDKGLMRRYRRAVQAIFQDPYSSTAKGGGHYCRAAARSGIAGPHRPAIEAALADVGLPPDALSRYPHEFSGGQRQRVALARAIVARPQLILADEAVSALDLSTRIRIVDLLKDLSKTITILLVSHDLGVVASLCEEIVILERGRIVESGRTADILARPQHPYTRKLLASVPRLPVAP